MAKASVAIEQKPALTEQATRRTSSQLLSASTETKSTSREARQVPCEPKTSLSKQVWRAKQKALCEVPAQLHPSREDRDKMPIQFGSIAKTMSREAKLVSLPSPNLGTVTPSVNLALSQVKLLMV